MIIHHDKVEVWCDTFAALRATPEPMSSIIIVQVGPESKEFSSNSEIDEALRDRCARTVITRTGVMAAVKSGRVSLPFSYIHSFEYRDAIWIAILRRESQTVNYSCNIALSPITSEKPQPEWILGDRFLDSPQV
jgi:hypothetical protein